MVNPKPHTYGMKSCEMVCYIAFFLMSKVDHCLFMSKTVTCVVYVDDCLFWACSKSEIKNLMKSFKEVDPSYNWETQR